jgi:branched-chain amino acid transport system permease protein
VAQVIIYGIITGAFYGLTSIGLSLVFGVMRHLNIAHGSLIMIGGFVAYWAFHLFKIDPIVSIPLVIVILFALGAALYKGRPKDQQFHARRLRPHVDHR